MTQEGKIQQKDFICEPNFTLNKDLNNCGICDATLINKHALQRHMKSVHEGVKPYNCAICLTSFTQKGNLNQHIKIVHKQQKPFKCEICEFSCSQKGNLTIHIETVHE